MKYAVAILVLLMGCSDRPDFPGSVGDLSYANGHPLAVNEVEEAACEADLYNLLNAARHAAGKGPLRWNDALCALGRANAIHQQIHDWVGYVNPEGEDVRDRLVRIARKSDWGGAEAVIIVSAWVPMADVLALMLQNGNYQSVLLGAYDIVGVGIVTRPFNGEDCHYITIELVNLL